MSPFVVVTQPTADEWGAAFAKANPVKHIAGNLLALGGLVLVSYQLIRETDLWKIASTTFAFLGAVLQLQKPSKKDAARNEALSAIPLIQTLTDDGIASVGPETTATIPWDDIPRFVETRELFILLSHEGPVLIPKRDIPGGRMEELRLLLQRNIVPPTWFERLFKRTGQRHSEVLD